MAGKKSNKRNQLTAIKAAQMHQRGCAHWQIAAATGLDMKVITNRIKLGERLLGAAAVPDDSKAP